MNSPGSRERRPVLSAFGAARTPSQLQETARLVEQAGFSGLWVPEGAQPVFEMCTAAALGTPSLRLGTSVAVAFARSPMLAAQAAWMLSQAIEGRFVLGLGTQVRAHVERRYSAPFSSPGPRMREYVEAVRAIFAGFRGAPLRFDGRFYSFSLLPPTWSPGPIDYADPPIYAAGVRPWMCRMVGEVADGMLVHPLSTPAYIDAVVIPAIEDGLQAGDRAATDVALVCPVMTAVSDDEEVRAGQRESIRARIAFYGSTPGYGVVFDASGWPGVGEELHRLQRAGDLEAMKRAITDEILDAIAITSTWADFPTKLVERFAGRADEIVCYSVVEQWRDETDPLGRWQDVNRRFEEIVHA
jgi:probable F420-dependent oxidoreductase